MGKVSGISFQLNGDHSTDGTIHLKKALLCSANDIDIPDGFEEVNSENILDVFMKCYNENLKNINV